ncbi:hypothetical protein Glove_551g66 [Diversispora epigaea]|uniref:DUF6826 domain-containing protein n=1 Tax=Diversispora epigaea TaxID=1348612 RepID=A0A397GK78_9GLOM|nr:hypothetical protein Glove_551g66 [Diversispora epigaea]
MLQIKIDILNYLYRRINFAILTIFFGSSTNFFEGDPKAKIFKAIIGINDDVSDLREINPNVLANVDVKDIALWKSNSLLQDGQGNSLENVMDEIIIIKNEMKKHFVFSTKTKPPGKFSEPPNKNSKANASEKDIQDYFMKECKVLENYRFTKNKIKHIVEDTRNSPILGTQKSDFVFIPKKKMLRLLVPWVDDYQKSIIQFKYEYIAPQLLGYNNSDDNNEWKYLVTFMESS